MQAIRGSSRIKSCDPNHLPNSAPDERGGDRPKDDDSSDVDHYYNDDGMNYKEQGVRTPGRVRKKSWAKGLAEGKAPRPRVRANPPSMKGGGEEKRSRGGRRVGGDWVEVEVVLTMTGTFRGPGAGGGSDMRIKQCPRDERRPFW